MKLSRGDSFGYKLRFGAMKKNLKDVLDQWPECVIREVDLAMILKKTDDARYSLVKRALKAGDLVRLKRGLYVIAEKTKQGWPDEFELSLSIYGPSFVSFESALSYHGWIPEAVYTTTCATAKRAKEFETPAGIFRYERVPEKHFYVGVNRIEKNGGVILVASGWRALADLIYVRRKKWESLADLKADLRIEKETLIESNQEQIEELVKNYPSARVQKLLKKFLYELKQLKLETK